MATNLSNQITRPTFSWKLVVMISANVEPHSPAQIQSCSRRSR